MTRLKTTFLFTLLWLFNFLVAANFQPAGDYRTLEKSLDYKHESKSDGPLSIHVIRIDRTRSGWDWTTAFGDVRIMGLSPVTQSALAVAKSQNGRVVAAINGDWFELKAGPYQGDPRGLQITQGELVSAPATDHAAFWLDKDGKPHMGKVQSRLRIVWPDGKLETPLGLNEHRPDGQAVLYTPALGHKGSEFKSPRQSTRTEGGRELVLEPTDETNWLPLQAGKEYKAKIAEIREAGDTPLGPRTVVVSLSPKLTMAVPKVTLGDVVTLKLETSPGLAGVRTAIGGGLHYVKEGKLVPLGKVDPARHPRSMFGWNDKHYFMVVVDGRQPKLSIGMTYPEMADLAIRLGCSEAMALDGGGSSTLWAEQRVLNSPSDGQPRGVANALIMVERKPKGP